MRSSAALSSIESHDFQIDAHSAMLTIKPRGPLTGAPALRP
jgi:hypothetical protein